MENINEVKIKTKNTITKLLTPENFDEVIKEYKSPIETENNNTSIIVDDRYYLLFLFFYLDEIHRYNKYYIEYHYNKYVKTNNKIKTLGDKHNDKKI